jgi:putative hydrolase of the HAD superfamily
MPLAQQLDAVLFDVGGVLLAPHPRYLRPVAERHGIRAGDAAFVRGHYWGVRAMYVHSSGHDDWPQYHRAMAQQLGAVGGAADALAADLHLTMSSRASSDRWWTFVLPGTVETMRELHRRGVPMGIVSNADGRVAEDLAATGVCQVGDGPGVPVTVVVDSAVVGVAKPDPAIFDHALGPLAASLSGGEAGVRSSRVAYVGDTVRNDVRGASAAGLTPVQIDPFGLHRELDHVRIQHLTDLLTWF